MTANLYGQWQNNMKWVRIFAIVSAVLWSTYAFYTGIYTAMLTELLKGVSSAVGLWRFRNEAKPRPEESDEGQALQGGAHPGERERERSK